MKLATFIYLLHLLLALLVVAGAIYDNWTEKRTALPAIGFCFSLWLFVAVMLQGAAVCVSLILAPRRGTPTDEVFVSHYLGRSLAALAIYALLALVGSLIAAAKSDSRFSNNYAD